jgi:hypothetical protein
MIQKLEVITLEGTETVDDRKAPGKSCLKSHGGALWYKETLHNGKDPKQSLQ